MEKWKTAPKPKDREGHAPSLGPTGLTHPRPHPLRFWGQGKRLPLSDRRQDHIASPIPFETKATQPPPTKPQDDQKISEEERAKDKSNFEREKPKKKTPRTGENGLNLIFNTRTGIGHRHKTKIFLKGVYVASGMKSGKPKPTTQEKTDVSPLVKKETLHDTGAKRPQNREGVAPPSFPAEPPPSFKKPLKVGKAKTKKQDDLAIGPYIALSHPKCP